MLRAIPGLARGKLMKFILPSHTSWRHVRIYVRQNFVCPIPDGFVAICLNIIRQHVELNKG